MSKQDEVRTYTQEEYEEGCEAAYARGHDTGYENGYLNGQHHASSY